MLPEYEKILETARSKRKENKSFFLKLKKYNPKDLDEITHQFHEEAFSKIDCLKCANCCFTTGPLLKNRDINNLSKELNLRPAEFTEKYLRVDEDNDYVFKKMPCPFLGTDNYCSVYQSRPGACSDYPHTQERNIATKLPALFLNSMICPAVAVVTTKLRLHYRHLI
jgi:Fe-S-cluster containining protein